MVALDARRHGSSRHNMEQQLSPDERDELRAQFPAIHAAMTEHTARHLCAIYGVLDDDSGRLVGSSTLLSLRDETFLLTAEHVVQAKRKSDYSGLAHTTRQGAPPRVITTPISCAARPRDLALVPLDVTELDSTPLSIENLATSSTLADRDVLFFHGYPQMLSHTFNSVYSKTFPYTTTPGTSELPWFDPRLHFAIDYAANGIFDGQEKPTDMVNPHGLSGATVWSTGYCTAGDQWYPSVARIVGVVHTWDQQSQSLVGTRIEAVREFILQTLRSRHAYSSWERRGRPAGDDWSDWFSAIREVPSL